MADRSVLVVVGSGSLARAVCCGLAAVADLARADEVAELLWRTEPAGVLLCPSTQSPWERPQAPPAWTALLERAGFGLALPLHAELALVVGRAVAEAAPQAWFVNAWLPDAVNPLLALAAVRVLCGIGNVALLAASPQAALGLEDQAGSRCSRTTSTCTRPGEQMRRRWCGCAAAGSPCACVRNRRRDPHRSGGAPTMANSATAATPDAATATPVVSGNLLLDFYDWLPRAIASCVPDVAPVRRVDAFSPGFLLPELDDDMRRFLEAATASWWEVGSYHDHRLVLLDLTANPGTNTTKTFASLLIVARAVEYVRRAGEPVMIFSPTSANKGVALRDAALLAIAAGLATPQQLRVAILAPASCRHKLRASRLSGDPELRALNPVLEYGGADPEGVKALGREFVTSCAADLRRALGVNLWFSLELRNYLIADTARAFFEQRVDPIDAAGRPRLHAHAVSSALGLLGYHQVAVQLIAQVRKATGVRLPMRTLFEASTVTSMAARVERLPSPGEDGATPAATTIPKLPRR